MWSDKYLDNSDDVYVGLNVVVTIFHVVTTVWLDKTLEV